MESVSELLQFGTTLLSFGYWLELLSLEFDMRVNVIFVTNFFDYVLLSCCVKTLLTERLV